MKDKDFSDKEMLDMYEYKRSYPRIEINSPISLFLSQSQETIAIAHDISIEGLRVHLDNQTSRRIEGDNNSNELEINFSLPIANRQESITAHCAIMYMFKLVDDTLAMGLKITEIDENQLNCLRQFIENSLEPL